MDYLIGAIVGYAVGYWFRGIMVLYNLSRNPEAVIKALEEIKKINQLEEQGVDLDTTPASVLNKEGTELFIERVNNHLYAYVKETNQFVAQGSDLTSLLEEAHKRFPNKLFFGEIDADDPAKELAQ
jgi:DNA helicase HerA-like ATPase